MPPDAQDNTNAPEYAKPAAIPASLIQTQRGAEGEAVLLPIGENAEAAKANVLAAIAKNLKAAEVEHVADGDTELVDGSHTEESQIESEQTPPPTEA